MLQALQKKKKKREFGFPVQTSQQIVNWTYKGLFSEKLNKTFYA